MFFGNFIKSPKESLQRRQRGGSGQCVCVCACMCEKEERPDGERGRRCAHEIKKSKEIDELKVRLAYCAK